MSFTKRGARNNSQDAGRIRSIRKMARDIDGITREMEPDDEDEEQQDEMPMKADDLPAPDPVPVIFGAVKAAGDWELDVLGVPFGSAAEKDAHGEYFTQRTNLYLSQFPKPLILYYHGYTPDGKPQGDPEIIGTAKSLEQRADGVWYRVVLDRASTFAARIWDAAKKGLARASSGSLAHLVRAARDGEILSWPVAEISLIDVAGKRQPANNYAVALPVAQKSYQRAGVNLPEILEPDASESGASNQPGVKTMTEELNDVVSKAVAAALAQRDEATKAEQKRADDIAAAVKSARDEWETEAATANRLPTKRAPYVTKFDEVAKFDNIDAADTALIIGILNGTSDHRVKRASPEIYKALAIKVAEGKDDASRHARHSLKAAGFNTGTKADEIMQQDLASYGDEWVGIGYGTQLWENIRNAPGVLAKVPQSEIPQGMETFYDPTEGADPTWYKVPEVTAIDSTMKTPVATVTTSQIGTGRSNAALAKIGARVLWSGELDEDSLINMAGELRRKFALSGAEMLDHAIIDGDTEAGASTNVNDIGGTPAGTEVFMTVNGFRKLALVTNTANSRSAGGALAVGDFLDTVKLMGTAGGDALDVRAVSFLVDLNTRWAAMQLPEVLTRDVFSAPTIENGALTGLYGYELMASPFMHLAQPSRKANSAGKIDLDTAGNNLYGSILAVRWNAWKFGWKRKMTMETTRIANADAYEIVALARFGLKYYSTEASAITYYVGV